MLSLSKHLHCGCVLLLAACSQPGADAPAGEKIECALDGATDFAAICSMESADEGVIFRRPDGGFRRVIIDGGNTRSADGADELIMTQTPDLRGFDFKIADDRFRVR